MARKKSIVYLDTSFISAFWYDGADIAMMARRLRTREWWDQERREFAVTASRVSEAELAAGTFPRQSECLRMVRRLRYFPVTADVDEFAEALVDAGLVPETKSVDAVHLAIASVHRVDYLLTWNYAHMANPVSQRRLEALCNDRELTAPLMVSPEMIPQQRLGQSIRRKRKS